ncbi:hypothetical protein BBJ29_009958 [Phytophthora kernoviae]|uniref:Uncharacterized protein n=1 Tax=Phytophthora kernoviae TaxID=325452 RepID=A0A3F2RCX3_9STRA|nr:hypothetical protein BBJ29_009958 [Phytophthora kernoviae]RLN50779.1 hypothetical protein BBP00_00009997 [Phytophthora kernoviae]
MTTVAPSPAHVPLRKTLPGRFVAVFVRVLTWITKFAGRLPGQDTVSKLDAFERFRQEISPWQVAGILIMTPLPFLIFNILIELIPLNDPAVGFWGSGCYQLRMFLTAICSAIAPAMVKLNCVPGFPVNSPRALAIYGLFEAVICLGTNMIISLAVNTFPVPFSQFTVIIPMAVAGRLIFFRQLPDDPQFHALSNKVNQWLSMETLPILVYPVFTAVFMILTSTQQLWLSLLLPALKLSVRRMLWVVAKNDDDLVGAMTCCVGHLYHILFTAMILQNSKTLETLVVYLLVVFRLNNRHYFATLVYLTTVEAVNTAATRLLLLCGMETVFLIIYLVLIWRRLGFSGVYQLAFVLYSQRVLVQAKFYLTIIILGFPLTHNGNDSILRFDSFT